MDLKEQIELAKKIVASWPLWKQNYLEQCSRPKMKEPREPIIRDDESL